jgi:hypothetical protein
MVDMEAKSHRNSEANAQIHEPIKHHSSISAKHDKITGP